MKFPRTALVRKYNNMHNKRTTALFMIHPHFAQWPSPFFLDKIAITVIIELYLMAKKGKKTDFDISLLVVDDDEYIRDSFSKLIALRGYSPYTAANGKEAIAILKKSTIDVVITDVRMPEMDGMQLLKKVKEKFPDIDVIVITGYGSVDSAVEAMRQGATDYILKPFSLDEILLKVVNICQGKRKGIRYEKINEKAASFPIVIAETDAMKEVLQEVEIVAPTNATVLISGETGVGKDIVARLIHCNSKRNTEPFIRMNCAELNEGIIESELFGHEKGSFTGAVAQKRGRLELAHKGTLFLDEVADVPLSTQKKLLRVLENREFERVGGTETISIDVRIIAATNRILSQAVKKKEFRRDLYYRLNTVMIKVPPLRQRNEDILPLAEHFLERHTEGKKCLQISKDVRDMLLSYDWPGNVRELKSTIERAVIFSRGETINPDKLFGEKDSLAEIAGAFTIECPSLTLDDVEKSLLLKVLRRTGWNIQQSSHILKISRTTLYEKIKKYELESYRQENKAV
jgi:DNA-binding NtrC family response regulator